ncbi:protein kinase [Myxococcota bacterium]|nr:protein kinase [Myxococcota bacterium]
MAGPTTIGRYRLVRRVGAGGMGIVYEAVDTNNGERVALKVLLPHAAEEAEGLLRFKREFRALARLRHPNIVRVFDSGLEDDVPYIAMEFLDGRDIRGHLRTFPEGPARDREMRRCLRQIFGALAYIHARRIVHRDLKPENILVTSDGRVKLMDFGVARLLRSPTSSSGLLGTFAYMAPEQVTTGEIDGRSDLYAVGVLMYEVLAGGYPFPVEPPAAALHHHVNTPPEHVRHVNPKADPKLAALTHRLLEKDPLDRLQTAEEAFPLLADGEPTTAGVTTGENPVPGLLFSPRFVGRKEQLDRLEGVASDASAGRGRLVIVEGPSGSGKSRLVEELRLRVRRRTHVLVGQCARERTQPYGPIQPVLDGIETIASRVSEDVMSKILGRDAALVHAVSPRLAALGGPATIAHLDPQERKIRMHKAIVGVIGRLALTKSVVLVLEDLHWADASTLELLWDAARTLLAPRTDGTHGETVCPVAIVLTRRSIAEGEDYSEALVRRLEERMEVERVRLTPIDAVGAAEMLRTMTGVQRPLAKAIDELAQRGRGSPLIIQEMIQSWVDDGALVRRQGAWFFRGERLDTAPPPASLSQERPAVRVPEDETDPPRTGRTSDATGDAFESEIPTGDHTPPPPVRRASLPPPARPQKRARDDVALTKLNRLGRNARALVERLSLLGRLLPSDIVFALSDMEEEPFLDAIDELVRQNVLVEDVAHDGVRYRFYHEGFRETVARSLPKVKRAEIHLFTARTLERAFRSRRIELAHVLARHWKSAGQPERAAPYLLAMANAAAARGDLEGALRRIEDVLAIIDEGPRTAASATRRLRVVIREIDLLLDFGRPREALERAEPQAAAEARAPEVMAAELTLRRAACQFALGRLDETLATLGRIGQRAPTRSLGARLLELEGRTRMARGEHAQARAVLQAAHDIAADAGLVELATDLDARIGIVLLHQGDYVGALARLEDGLAYARQRGDTRAVADLLGHIGMIHAARGNSTEALACYREAIELAEARGVRAELERWSGELGMLMTQLGSYAEARERLEEALEIAKEMGSRQGEATWRGELGIHFTHAGNLERASQELLRCLAISREIGFARYEAWAQVYLGALALERSYENVRPALEHIEAGLELAEDLAHEELRIVGLLHLGRVRRAEGDLVRARASFDRADRLAFATQNLRLRARVQAELARLVEP